MRPLTPYMKTTLIDLYQVVMEYDNGKPLLPHGVKDVHHKILKGLADDNRKLIILEASNSPAGIVWTVYLTPKGLREGKKLAKDVKGINANAITPTRKRITIQVQLHETKNAETIEAIQSMKDTKGESYTKFVIQSIALHNELKAGQVGLLQTLYPEAYATMLMIAWNDIEIDSSGELRGLIDEFKRHVQNAPRLQNNAVSSVLQSVGGSTQAVGLKALSNPVEIKAPVFDEDDDDLGLEVTASVGHGMQVALNFQKSVLGLLNEKSTDGSGLTPRQKAQMGME